MLCIASFFVFVLLGLFSATHRHLAAKAWYCIARKLTFRPCDINFNEELKGKLLGKMIFTHPRLARFLNRWIDWVAFVFVALSIWSLVAVFFASINLIAYDTCDPYSGEGCSLSGEACGVAVSDLGFFESLFSGRGLEWGQLQITTFGETLTRIPLRFRHWEAKEFVSPTASYLKPYDAQKPVALEIIDPSCVFCGKLSRHIEEAGLAEHMNVTYILYPIPSKAKSTGYRFPHSAYIARVVEAAKTHTPSLEQDRPLDWYLLKHVFTGKNAQGLPYQDLFNTVYSQEEVRTTLQEFMIQYGLSSTEAEALFLLADSDGIVEQIEKQRKIVEEEVRTIKIPTFLIGGKRFDRVIDVETMRSFLLSSERK